MEQISIGGVAAAVFIAGAGFAIVLWQLFTPRKEFRTAEDGRDKGCYQCRADIAARVTQEALTLQLEPIRKELEHRKGSVDTLGKALARMERRWHRLDKAITAIATKLDVDVPPDLEE